MLGPIIVECLMEVSFHPLYCIGVRATLERVDRPLHVDISLSLLLFSRNLSFRDDLLDPSRFPISYTKPGYCKEPK